MYKQEEIDSIFNEICLLIETGLSLRAVLKQEDMPSSQTFFKWIDGDEQKSKQYARACEGRSDSIFEDILQISDDQENDVYKDEKGNEFVNYNVINRSKLRVDSRKWMLSKLNPKKYSDKIQVDQSEFVIQPLFPDVHKNKSNK